MDKSAFMRHLVLILAEELQTQTKNLQLLYSWTLLKFSGSNMQIFEPVPEHFGIKLKTKLAR